MQTVLQSFGFHRLAMGSITGLRYISTCTHPLHFQMTNALLGEPLKKKKRLDPAILRAREERRKKKLEKQIRRLQKFSKQLKPIFEVEVATELTEEKGERLRHLAPLTVEELERRAMLEKEWCKYKQDQWARDLHVIECILASQENALKELQAVSKELYQKAIELDDSFLPYDAVGPVHTPAIDNYNSPDGDYTDTTFKYEGES